MPESSRAIDTLDPPTSEQDSPSSQVNRRTDSRAVVYGNGLSPHVADNDAEPAVGRLERPDFHNLQAADYRAAHALLMLRRESSAILLHRRWIPPFHVDFAKPPADIPNLLFPPELFNDLTHSSSSWRSENIKQRPSSVEEGFRESETAAKGRHRSLPRKRTTSRDNISPSAMSRASRGDGAPTKHTADDCGICRGDSRIAKAKRYMRLPKPMVQPLESIECSTSHMQ
ncbi:hypothetical protein BAUCODRAFT_452966 [Baudoinia panamericana UAMH 10762]|uniref:Uncharacterized protein n=1 Tax=Baudoinia panamericana (strain UAMH 10762) TaxID=717646 RepID=M2MLA8_BAUPA|nr:uncharacterized protein BAUCODRAFT_452966 [Baudoinia panamericana UAMH 10762]EMC97456.1 hypothetical protein BAUCODRAFT_452966 [Baudoinia panamericana UAMH 10762]